MGGKHGSHCKFGYATAGRKIEAKKRENEGSIEVKKKKETKNLPIKTLMEITMLMRAVDSSPSNLASAKAGDHPAIA